MTLWNAFPKRQVLPMYDDEHVLEMADIIKRLMDALLDMTVGEFKAVRDAMLEAAERGDFGPKGVQAVRYIIQQALAKFGRADHE